MNDSAGKLLQEIATGVDLSFTWLGLNKVVEDEHKLAAANMFKTDPKSVSLTKKLINPKNVHYRNLTACKTEIRAHWMNNTLPWIESGVRLIRHEDILAFRLQHEELVDGFNISKKNLTKHWKSILQQSEETLGDLFNKEDYPEDPEDLFGVNLGWPNLSAPEYLKTLDPKMYEAEAKKISKKFEDAWKLGEEVMTKELLKLVESFADRMKPNPDGTKKIFKEASLTNLFEFFDKFNKLNLIKGSDLEDLVKKSQEALSGTNAEIIRLDDNFRNKLANSLDEISKELNSKVENLPRRKLGKVKNVPTKEAT